MWYLLLNLLYGVSVEFVWSIFCMVKYVEKNEMEIKLFLFQKGDFVMEVHVLRVKLSIFAFLNGTIYFHLARRVA